MTDRSRAVMRILLGLVMALLGISIALVSNSTTGAIGVLGRSLGLSLIVTGSVTIFQEGVLAPLRKDELRRRSTGSHMR